MKPLLFALFVAGCASQPDPPEPWPARAPSYYTPLLTNGEVNPDWINQVQPDSLRIHVPDTLALPRQRLSALVRVASGDTLRANVVAEVAGYELCAPCPADLQCEPCGPDRIVLMQWASPYAVQTLGWFELPPASYSTLRAFRSVVASVEVVGSAAEPQMRLLGMAP